MKRIICYTKKAFFLILFSSQLFKAQAFKISTVPSGVQMKLFFLALFIPLAITAQGWRILDSLNTSTYDNRLIELKSGEVLSVGGLYKSCEIYNFETNKWQKTDSLNEVRTNPFLALLDNGKVLAAGGRRTKTCEIFDPETETWEYTDSMHYVRGWSPNFAIQLKDGNILAVGGDNLYYYPAVCEIYEQTTGKWRLTDSLEYPRWQHTIDLLENGKVLITGGLYKGTMYKSCEVFDPETETWSSFPDLPEPRTEHDIAVSGSKLVLSGGQGFRDILSFNSLTNTWDFVGLLANEFNISHKMYILNEKEMLVMGGSKEKWEIFSLSDFTREKSGITPFLERGYDLIKLEGKRFIVAGGEKLIGMFLMPSKFSYVFDFNISGIEEKKNRTKIFPDKITLYWYPNPFNNQSTLYYTLDETSEVLVELYDIKGEKLTTLFNGARAKGEQTLKVNFGNLGLSSGVYFSRLSTERGSYSTKLLLTK